MSFNVLNILFGYYVFKMCLSLELHLYPMLYFFAAKYFVFKKTVYDGQEILHIYDLNNEWK